MFELDRYEYLEDENLGLLKHMPKNQTVLDVGCGAGLLGERLRLAGNTVVGIDNAEAIANQAQGRLNEFYLADITNEAVVSNLLGDKRFDAIYFADLLEHIYDPVRVLSFYRKFLKPGGKVYISVPNIAVWYVRFGLLFGGFKYQQTGTLDKTHIRFFTKANLLTMLSASGYYPDKIDLTPGLARSIVPLVKRFLIGDKSVQNRRVIIESKSYRIYQNLIYPVEYILCRLAPKFLAFQFIAVASIKENSVE